MRDKELYKNSEIFMFFSFHLVFSPKIYKEIAEDVNFKFILSICERIQFTAVV